VPSLHASSFNIKASRFPETGQSPEELRILPGVDGLHGDRNEATMRAIPKLASGLILTVLLAFGAKAQEVKTATTLICSSAEHAKQFVITNKGPRPGTVFYQ
jgi:hypothetical protein